MKKAIKLRESELRRIISESVKKTLNENYNDNGKSYPIDPSDLAQQLYNSGCDFYMFVHNLEKTYEMIKDEKNTSSENDFPNIGKISKNTVFYISIEHTIDGEITPQEVDVLRKISDKYQKNIEYDGETNFFVYDKDALYSFIKDIKRLGLGKDAFIYKGQIPINGWKYIGQITI
jgi:hypothetical protein